MKRGGGDARRRRRPPSARRRARAPRRSARRPGRPTLMTACSSPGRRNSRCLGLGVALHVAVVVEVVAAQVAERRDPHAHAVDAPLVERVRGDFHRDVGRAGVGKRAQLPVQRDDIGRRQRPALEVRREAGAQRAEVGAAAAEPLDRAPRAARRRWSCRWCRSRRRPRGAPKARRRSGRRCRRAGRAAPAPRRRDDRGGGVGPCLPRDPRGSRARRGGRFARVVQPVPAAALQRDEGVARRRRRASRA